VKIPSFQIYQPRQIVEEMIPKQADYSDSIQKQYTPRTPIVIIH